VRLIRSHSRPVAEPFFRSAEDRTARSSVTPPCQQDAGSFVPMSDGFRGGGPSETAPREQFNRRSDVGSKTC
jgi:hypothetical protein